jgi:hypothetical protein
MEFVPLAHLAHICRERGVTTALDNTGRAASLSMASIWATASAGLQAAVPMWSCTR